MVILVRFGEPVTPKELVVRRLTTLVSQGIYQVTTWSLKKFPVTQLDTSVVSLLTTMELLI